MVLVREHQQATKRSTEIKAAAVLEVADQPVPRMAVIDRSDGAFEAGR
jgi:hypothetical protein